MDEEEFGIGAHTGESAAPAVTPAPTSAPATATTSTPAVTSVPASTPAASAPAKVEAKPVAVPSTQPAIPTDATITTSTEAPVTANDAANKLAARAARFDIKPKVDAAAEEEAKKQMRAAKFGTGKPTEPTAATTAVKIQAAPVDPELEEKKRKRAERFNIPLVTASAPSNKTAKANQPVPAAVPLLSPEELEAEVLYK